MRRPSERVLLSHLKKALDLILEMSMAFPSSDTRYRRAVTLSIELACLLRRTTKRRRGALQ